MEWQILFVDRVFDLLTDRMVDSFVIRIIDLLTDVVFECGNSGRTVQVQT